MVAFFVSPKVLSVSSIVRHSPRTAFSSIAFNLRLGIVYGGYDKFPVRLYAIGILQDLYKTGVEICLTIFNNHTRNRRT